MATVEGQRAAGLSRVGGRPAAPVDRELVRVVTGRSATVATVAGFYSECGCGFVGFLRPSPQGARRDLREHDCAAEPGTLSALL